MDITIDSTTKSILVGIISGVSASFILLILKNLWINTLFPVIENAIYKDLKIEGKWYGIYTNTSYLRQDIIEIKRKGHNIEGTLTCISEYDKGEIYVIKGSFKNLILSLTYETQDKCKTDRGSLTLMAKNNGCLFRGKIALYENNSDAITDWNIIWFRDNEHYKIMTDNLEKYRDKLDLLINEKEEISVSLENLESDMMNKKVIEPKKIEKKESNNTPVITKK